MAVGELESPLNACVITLTFDLKPVIYYITHESYLKLNVYIVLVNAAVAQGLTSLSCTGGNCFVLLLLGLACSHRGPVSRT